jgi:anti-sigma factor RsiW
MCDTLGADMESPQCRAMRAHVMTCPNCTAYLASLRKTVDLYASYPLPKLSAKATSELLRSCRALKKK